MIATAYTLIKDFQTGIGSLIGMLGLLVVAWVAWRLNRVRDDMLRREEAKSTAAALYGEIREIRERIAGLANTVASHELNQYRPIKELLQSHVPAKPLIYESLAGKFGILPNDAVLSIIKFHADVSEAIRGVELYTAKLDVNYSSLVILEPAIRAVVEARTALDSLGIVLSIPSEPGPDIRSAVEMEFREKSLYEMADEEMAKPH